MVRNQTRHGEGMAGPLCAITSMMAAASMITLPVLVLALCVQRYIQERDCASRERRSPTSRPG